MFGRFLLMSVVACSLFVLGCGDDENGGGGDGGAGGTAGTGGTGGEGGVGGEGGADGNDLEAPFDNDSLANPAMEYFLTPTPGTGTGVRDFAYSDQISEPAGDNDDFIEFEFPNNANPAQVVDITLDCTFSDAQNDAVVVVTIWEDGVEDLGLRVMCNEGEQSLTVDNTKVQTARIHFSVGPSGDTQTLVDYTLTVVGFD